MHQKPHKFLDRPILGYFLLFLSAYLLCITVGTLDRLVGLLLPDFGISSGPGMALGATGGVMTGFGLGDWITTVAAAIGAVIALKWMDRKYYPKIMEVWEKKWNKNGPVGGVQ